MIYDMYNNNDNNSNNECQKFPEETFFGDFNKHFLKISLLLWKKSVLHTTVLWFYEILFFQGVIVMVNNKKGCAIKDTMSIKISFMHYRNYITWTRVIRSFWGIWCYLYFLAPFFFSLILSIGKRSTLVKIWGSGFSPLHYLCRSLFLIALQAWRLTT